WSDLKYPTGGGNFPLWESDMLRQQVFRALFDDWQNPRYANDNLGDGFPVLGDTPSPDPNRTPGITKKEVPSLVTSFEDKDNFKKRPGVPAIPIGTELNKKLLETFEGLVHLIENL